jgi:hypothetical protein
MTTRATCTEPTWCIIPSKKKTAERQGGYTHMLGQAAAMLIPFPAAIATQVCRNTLPLSLQYGTLAGATVPVLEFGIGF